MKAAWALILLGFCAIAPAVSAEEPKNSSAEKAAAKAALLEEIRDRILWYSEERTYPLLIPAEVFGLTSVEDLPVSAKAYIAIRNWLSSARTDAQAQAEHSDGGCDVPVALPLRVAPPRKQITLEEAMASRTSTLLVRVDKTTQGLRPDWGIYQYNEVTPLRVLAGSGVHQDPLATRAFLSEGGEIVVEGATYCSKSPWHPDSPQKGDVYLLLGSSEIPGVFNPSLYFRIEDGDIVPAAYSELRPAENPECVNGFETRRFRYLGTFIDLLSKAKTKAKDTVRAALHRRGQG